MNLLHSLSPTKLVLVFGLLLQSLFATASVDLASPLPVDPSVKIGRLKNGLTYYIQKNDKPKQIVELRLLVKFGSIHESDQQQGAAHFIEHLVFKNSKNFKNETLRPKLEGIGLQFGRDLNAYTEHELTRYEMSLPSSKKEHVQIGLTALADIAGHVEIRVDDISAEEAIILEEQRIRNNLELRKTSATYDLTLRGTKYPSRSPIGVEAIRKNFTAPMLQQLYRQMYRPDQMALIAVGDIDPLALEKAIQKLFSGLQNPPQNAEQFTQELPEFGESNLVIFTDPQQSTHRLELTYQVQNLGPFQTIGELRQGMLRTLYWDLLDDRLSTYSPLFTRAAALNSNLLRTKKRRAIVFEYPKPVDAASTQSAAKAAIRAVIGRLLQVQKYGFLESELNDRRKVRLNSFEQSYLERDKLSSDSFVNDYVNHFSFGENLTSTAQYWDLMQPLYSSITLQELNDYAKAQLLPESKPQMLYIAPKSDEEWLPSKQTILATIADAQTQKVEQVVARSGIKSLLKTPPTSAGKIVSETHNVIYGTTEFSLSNGVTVIIKKTDFTNNKISMFHQSLGGSSKAPINQVLSATYAPNLTLSMGFDDLSPRAVQEFLQPKTVALGINLTPYVETISGSSSTLDLETLLQWNYQRLVNSSRSKALFSSGLDRIKRNLLEAIERPEMIIHDQFTKLVYDNNPRAMFIPPFDEVESLNMDKVIASFDQLHQNFSGSYFVFVGNVDVDTMRPLLRKYLANLPGKEQADQIQPEYPLPKRGIRKKEIFVGKDNKASVRIIFNGAFNYTEEESLRFTLLTDILRLRLIQSLREERQLIYASGISSQLFPIAGGRYQLAFILPCAAEQTDAVVSALFQEIQRLQKDPPSMAELNQVKKAWTQLHKERLQDDDYWARQLLESKLTTPTARLLFAPEKLLKTISPESVRVAANYYLDQENYVQLVAKPENLAVIEQAEIEAYKKITPRDLGSSQINETSIRLAAISRALAKSVTRNEEFWSYSDSAREILELKTLEDRIGDLKVSTCLSKAKQTQLDHIRILLARFDLVKLAGTANQKDEKLSLEKLNKYADLLTTEVELLKSVSAQISHCDNRVQ
ncbi:insulinase family protein [Undibacterium amnicola]|uniref:Insulinase family protein n=1 Tax=Undibacterium amnicola TaxID=1834038 RepID=A0ABR6XSN7_9BURK|nr:M16 family metallopeptidase [Undibacterium amnicola]MBC3832044.1 insulinase family protein [Undibacterium amnicola]